MYIVDALYPTKGQPYIRKYSRAIVKLMDQKRKNVKHRQLNYVKRIICVRITGKTARSGEIILHTVFNKIVNPSIRMFYNSLEDEE